MKDIKHLLQGLYNIPLTLHLCIFIIFSCINIVTPNNTPKWALTGSNKRGVLGSSIRNLNTVFVNKELFINEIPEKARYVGCYRDGCFVLTQRGQLFMSGIGSTHASGHSFYKVKTKFHEVQLDSFYDNDLHMKDYIEWVSVGISSFVIRVCDTSSISEDITIDSDIDVFPICPNRSKLLTFGDGRFGELGTPNSFGVYVLSAQSLPFNNPSYFSVGEFTTVAVENSIFYTSSNGTEFELPSNMQSNFNTFFQSLHTNGTTISEETRQVVYYWGHHSKPATATSFQTRIYPPVRLGMTNVWNNNDTIIQIYTGNLDVLALANSGRIYLWRLGDTPKIFIERPMSEAVKKIYLRESHGIIVLENNDIMEIDYNNQNFRLTLRGTAQGSIKNIFSGNQFITYYDDSTSGALYYWRRRNSQASPLPIEAPTSPKNISSHFVDLIGFRFQIDSTGSCSTIGLQKDGTVVVYGSNKNQVLGLGEEIKSVNEITVVRTKNLNQDEIYDIVFDRNYLAFALAKSNEFYKLFTWGGDIHHSPTSLTPQELSLDTNDSDPPRIYAGYKVYFIFGNNYGKMISSTSFTITDIKSAILDKDVGADLLKTKAVYNANKINYLVTTEGNIYSWNPYTVVPVKIYSNGNLIGAGPYSNSNIVFLFSIPNSDIMEGITCKEAKCDPITVTLPEGTSNKFVQASIESGIGVLLHEDGTVYEFGRHSKCGNSTDDYTVSKVSYLSVNLQSPIVSIGTSSNMRYVLTSSKELYIWTCKNQESGKDFLESLASKMQSTSEEIEDVYSITFKDVTYVNWESMNAADSWFFITESNSMCNGEIASSWKTCNRNGKCINGQCSCFNGKYKLFNIDNCFEKWQVNLVYGAIVIVIATLFCLLFSCFAILIIFGSSLCCIRIIMTYRRIKRSTEKLRLLENEFKIELLEAPIDPKDSIQINSNLFRLSMEDLDIKEVIGHGGSGATVVRAIFRKNMPVAVKMFRIRDSYVMKEFTKEVNTFCRLRHHNIVQFIGFIEDSRKCGLVMEYCSGGSLASLIETLHKEEISFKKRLQYLSEIAHGVHYLHTQDIIHRDLKLENILISQHGECKLMDFGLSRLKDESNDTRMTQAIGTSTYSAPEVYSSQHYDERCDVFSFGILMYEIIGHTTTPYGDETNAFIGARVSTDPNFRPPLDSLQLAPHQRWISTLMQSCWSHSPDNRPSFEYICECLDQKYNECE